MDYTGVRQYIESRLNDNFSALTILWDNTGNEPTPGTAFVDCKILFAEELRVTLGDSYQARLPGFININIFVPKDSATNTALGHAETITGIFRGKHFSGIRCQQPTITRLGQDGEWFQYNVSIPFNTNSNETV